MRVSEANFVYAEEVPFHCEVTVAVHTPVSMVGVRQLTNNTMVLGLVADVFAYEAYNVYLVQGEVCTLYAGSICKPTSGYLYILAFLSQRAIWRGFIFNIEPVPHKWDASVPGSVG